MEFVNNRVDRGKDWERWPGEKPEGEDFTDRPWESWKLEGNQKLVRAAIFVNCDDSRFGRNYNANSRKYEAEVSRNLPFNC